jgi:hypothetical protein
VKLKDADKTDKVYINGSYAGEAKHLKSMHLDPGNYRVVVTTDEGQKIVDQQL